jgi:hypothetical protein
LYEDSIPGYSLSLLQNFTASYELTISTGRLMSPVNCDGLVLIINREGAGVTRSVLIKKASGMTLCKDLAFGLPQMSGPLALSVS